MRAELLLLLGLLLVATSAGARPWTEAAHHIQTDAEFRCCGGPWRNATVPTTFIAPGEPFEARLTFHPNTTPIPLVSARLYSPGFPCSEPQPYHALRGPEAILDPNTGRRGSAGYCETLSDWALNPGTQRGESEHPRGETWNWTWTLAPTGVWNGSAPVNVDLAIYRDGGLEETAEEVFTIAVVESAGREPPEAPRAPSPSPATLPRPRPATPGFILPMAVLSLVAVALRRR